MDKELFKELLSADLVKEGLGNVFDVLVPNANEEDKASLFEQFVQAKIEDTRYLILSNGREQEMQDIIMKHHLYSMKEDLRSSTAQTKIAKNGSINLKDNENIPSYDSLNSSINKHIEKHPYKEEDYFKNERVYLHHSVPDNLKLFNEDFEILFERKILPQLKQTFKVEDVLKVKDSIKDVIFANVAITRKLINDRDIKKFQSMHSKKIINNAIKQFFKILIPTRKGLFQRNKPINPELEAKLEVCLKEAMNAMYNPAYLSYIKGEQKLNERTIEESRKHATFSEVDIAKEINYSAHTSDAGGFYTLDSNLITVVLHEHYSLSTLIHETTHRISFNNGQGIMKKIPVGLAINEALTEYFAVQAYSSIMEKAPDYITPPNDSSYTRTIDLLRDFFDTYQEELKADYVKNGYKNSLTASIIGKESFEKLVQLTDKYWDLVAKNDFISSIKDDKDFCLNFDTYLMNPKNLSSKKNKERAIKRNKTFKEYYATIKEIRSLCSLAIQKKAEYVLQTKEENKKRR